MPTPAPQGIPIVRRKPYSHCCNYSQGELGWRKRQAAESAAGVRLGGESLNGRSANAPDTDARTDCRKSGADAGRAVGPAKTTDIHFRFLFPFGSLSPSAVSALGERPARGPADEPWECNPWEHLRLR